MKRSFLFILILIVLTTTIGGPVSQVSATGVRYATVDGIIEGTCPINAPCSIQWAVTIAGPGDTVYLESGTYTASFETDNQVILITKSLTLTGSCDYSSGTAVCSPTNDPSIISGELERRAINIQIASGPYPSSIEINFLHILGGNAENLGSCITHSPYQTVGCGGGIYSVQNESVNLRVNFSKFWLNFGAVNQVTPGSEAGYGGAIYFQSPDGTLEVDDTFFLQNAAVRYGRGDGGAIFASGNALVSINRNGFSENYCSSNSAAGSGCAIFATQNTEVNLDRNLFNLNNKTAYLVEGGAINLMNNDHFVVHGNIFTENTGATVISGRNAAKSTSGKPPDYFSQNWFWNNNATDALFYQGENAVDIFNNFIGHLSTASTHILSGIKVTAVSYSDFMHVNIIHNSIAYLDYGITLGSDLNVSLENNIIAYNRVKAVNAVGPYANVSADTNLAYGNIQLGFSDPNLVNANPRFVNGEHGNFHLLPISPAINAGMELGYSSDIDNEHRPTGLPDIGADEYYAYNYLPLVNR